MAGLQKEKSKLALGGQETIQGKPANAVVLTTVKNVKIKLYFDAASDCSSAKKYLRERSRASSITPISGQSET